MEKAESSSAVLLPPSNQKSKRKSPPLPNAAPWLVIPNGKGAKYQTFYNISEPNNTAHCKISIPELKGKSAYQNNSCQGWLIVLCDDRKFDYTPWKYGDCFLWNPLSMESIKLPSLLDWYSLEWNWFTDCVLSAPPKSSTDDGRRNEKSIVFMLFGGEKHAEGILVFCRPGDKEWSYYMISCDDIDDIVGEFQSLCYFKGKVHVMCRGSSYIEFEMQHGSKPRVLSMRNVEPDRNLNESTRGFLLGSDDITTYYVESSDGIFRIEKAFIPRDDIKVYIPRDGVPEYCVTDLEITKLDFSSMSWVEVTSLDDHVFFLNGYTRLCCSVKELGLTRGCVYFTQPGEMTYYKYDLEDNSITLSLPCPDLEKPWFSPNWLMIPTQLLSSIGRVGEKRRVTKHFLGDGSQVLKSMGSRISLNNDDSKEGVEEAITWELDDDLVWSISNYLNPVDYIHFRAVSKIYRSIIPLVNRRRSCSTKNTNLSPWLVFSKDRGAVHSFINPMHNNENYLMSIPELLQGSTIRYSKGSWLLMSKGYRSLFFYNPFTKAIIKLPRLRKDFIFSSEVISFSSLPTSADCTVFAIQSHLFDRVEISLIKRGDKKWKSGIFRCDYKPPTREKYKPRNRENMYFKPSLNSPVFHNGAFYCLDLNGILGVCTLENRIKWKVFSKLPRPDCDSIYASYLVESEGKLVSVLLGQYGEWVRVFRLNLAEMAWIEVENLGRHVLFISNTACIATIAPTSRMENKIYFPRLKNEGILFYSLDSGKYHSLESECSSADYCNSKHNLWCSWIEPNWSETTQPKFDWS